MTEQEAFWASDFGDEYTERNDGMLLSNMSFFANILHRAPGIESILELGCNKGLNLLALDRIYETIDLTGIDVNEVALRQVFEQEWKKKPTVTKSSIAKYEDARRYDLVFTKGVLIHLNPDQLNDTYKKMYDLSNRYILIAEYYNPTPVEIEYRGNSGKLFKRDFAGEMLDLLPIKLIDYGFVYHRDKNPQDDLHWFLFDKGGV